MENEFFFVTGNQNKLNEVKNILSSNFKINSVKYDLPEYQGDVDFIITKKCEYAFNQIRKPVLVEDTSLEINCLNGLPGPYIKWFMDKIGSDGIYKLIQAWSDKKAKIVCLIGFQDSNNSCKIFKGTIEGEIVKPVVSTSFGFDNCFKPEGFDKTLAELGPDIKDKISHRSEALKKFQDYIKHDHNFIFSD